MSEPAPRSACSSLCPVALEPAELVSDGNCRTCIRYSRAILVLLVVNLLASVVFGVLGAVRDDSTEPSPKPSPTATATPSPSDPDPSGGPTPTPEPTPTASMPPDPTDGGCNIFDPECSSTGGSSNGTTGGVEA
ncbi:hypothetical protein [Streptomyces sp. NPDC050121]|uniref:hypothetical protein n=1 Tax=Streptomyces sp. NPDC050121 TaxID=3365601 RepID=UPI0037A1F986